MIAFIDEGLKDLIKDKKMVVYTPNSKGQMPNTYNKGMIPSSIPLCMNWYVGYTSKIMSDFNMFPITDEIGIGLQFFNIVNGANKRYDKYFMANPDNAKLVIELSDSELQQQLVSKKFIMILELGLIYSKKIKEASIKYGAEADTWDLQLSEANEYIQDTNPVDSDYTIIYAIAQARGRTLTEVAQSIISNNKSYKQTIGKLLAAKYSKKDEINAATTNNELINILETL